MDRPMPGRSEDSDFSWSDSQSIESEDNARLAVISPPLWPTSTSMTKMDSGQLSPISTEIESPAMDRPPGPIEMPPPMIYSAASSRTNSWSTTYSEMADFMGDMQHDTRWEQDSEDILTVPKLEPVEDDEFHLDEVDEVPRSPALDPTSSTTSAKTKRPRGRPRKHPLVAPQPASKAAKGRSKTGCITCRKRKKKCDEAKPRCMNCEKNAVVCEGYNAKTIWKSGRERAEQEKHQRQSLPGITLQPIFRGVETPEDRVFFNHYINELSGVLTVESEHRNAFKDMLLRMSVEHNGLMHSILSLASSHMDMDTPYGRKILGPNSKVTQCSLSERSEFHRSAAMESIQANIAREVQNEPDQKVSLCLRYGQMLCLLLQTMAEGTTTGAHRVHLQAYKHLISDSPPEDSEFLVFITEYFQFHVYADELIRYPDAHTPRLATEDWTPWVTIQPTRLIGVGDGLFRYLCHITSIRNAIRTNMASRHDPIVDYTSLYRAAEIDEAIRDWDPQWPPGDTRDRVALLYKQMMWIYLFRTIYPPTSSAPIFRVGGMAASSTAVTESRPPSPKSQISRSGRSIPSGDSQDTSPTIAARSESPPPIRYPPHHDHRITLAVDESLAILESFNPSDPVQALLLTPSLVIGCACFAPRQRESLREVLRTIRGYTGMRNGDCVKELLEEVWRLMEQGDWVSVWDWQGVAKSMNLDFSCA